MFRVIPYRGFDIRITLTPVERDLYSATFQITGHNISANNLDGAIIKVRHGPFTARWAYLVAEIAGQAAVDVLTSPHGD